jgi:hypothetical protein
MKKLVLTGVLGVLVLGSIAQPIHPQLIEDSVLGWMKVYHFKGSKEGKKVDHRNYSAAQLSICDSFANWMQASYMPKGGWGDVVRKVSDKMGLYNQHTAGKPQSYGASAKTYNQLKYNASRKVELYTSDHIWWEISANAVPGWAIPQISINGRYYFTLPTALTEITDEEIKKRLDLTKNKNIEDYISLWQKNEGYGSGRQNVLLCKDNRSPFIKITRGEYFRRLEAAIPFFYQDQKKKIFEAEQGVEKRVATAMKSLDERIERFKTGLKLNLEKYKDRLQELAMVSTPQPNLNNLEFGRDIFTNQYLTDPETNNSKYAIYTIDSAMAADCKKDKPQWILVVWEYYSGASALEKQQHDAIVNNFNFEYVYNFFFAPDKVKGQPYKPLRSPIENEPVIVAASAISKKNAADKNVVFFEDFSQTAIGVKPSGWRTTLNNTHGTTSTVGRLDGLDGNWAELRGHSIALRQLAKPLPTDFTLSYELVAAENFTWGAKGLTLQLAKETSPGNAESYLNLRLRPGYDGRNGELSLETRFPYPPGYSNGTQWFVATGFSNNKKINRIAVSIKKKGEVLRVFLDGIKIAGIEKAIPAAHVFNALSFDCSGNSAENDKYYISNIKIIKEQ